MELLFHLVCLTCLDSVFATHGYPETVITDNGHPYPSYEMEKYAKEKGFRLTPVTPDDPQCNGFVESFVKLMCKLLNTAASGNKDPKTELYNYLLHYRGTPHSTTGRSPAELLFNRKLETKLPQIFTVKECDDLKDMRERQDEKRIQPGGPKIGVSNERLSAKVKLRCKLEIHTALLSPPVYLPRRAGLQCFQGET